MDYTSLPKVQNLTETERTVLGSIIRQIKTEGNFSKLDELWKVDYEEIPVSIDRFLEDDMYMGKVFQNGKLIYPFWRDQLRYIFEENPDNAFEIIISGAIGTGKSTISAIGMMYLIYRTLCLKDPQKFYGLTANSPIVFVCLNLTLELAYNGLYSMIVEAIKLSPWFQEKVDIRGRYDFSIEFPKNLQLITASNVQHTIGKNVLGCIMDELNFSNAPKGSKNSVLDMYRNIRRRLESRFLKQGRIPGFLFLVSSKNTEYDFLEQYIQTIKDNKTAYLIDKAVYDIKPPETYVGTKFKVAVGDKTKSSRIISDQEDINTILELGYKVIEVPTEYRIAFEQDINDALKDIAGISSVSTSKLIPYAGKIEACINKSRNSPLLVDEITLSLDTKESIKDYLDDLRILKKDLHIPRFGHIDIGIKGDSLGFCLVHAANTVSVERYSKDGKILSFLENKYQADLELRVRPLSGSEVPLYKIREFILYLVTSLGINIQMLTFDGFQSSDSIQLLKTAGMNVGLLSVDRTDEQYLNLRSCILEGRLDLYDQPTLIKELYELDHDIKNKKVDHPIDGSKDISDALCGAVWNAQKYYAEKKQTNVVQHQNVKQAVEFINTMNKKRWIDDKTILTDNWLFKD